MKFSRLKIRQKLWLGFGSVVILGLIFAAYSFSKMSNMDFYAQRIVNLRTPTVKASTGMVNGINESQTALLGWMHLNDEHFKEERAKAWLEIRKAEKAMATLSVNWTVPKNIERFQEIKLLLNQYNYFQTQIEEMPEGEAFDENKILFLTKNLHPLQEQLLDILNAMVKNQHGLLQTDGTLINQDLSDFIYQLGFSTFIVVLLALGLIYYTSRDISRPILEIVEAMESVAMGDFKAVPNAPKPNDRSETARLKSGLRQMVSDIEQVLLVLESSKKDAEAANEAKTSFLDNMNHELRTPLNSIIGFSDLILTGAGGELSPPNYKEYVQYINQSGEHLLELINDMLDMSKIEAGKLVINLETIDVRKVIHDCMNMVMVRLAKKDLEIECMVPDHFPNINVDVRAFKQILLNLLTNAIKFTEPKGKVMIIISETPMDFKFCVEDTGKGMDEKGIIAAMEPFVQVMDEKGRGHEGTGLGLPLCKNLVELHKGKFWLESELGKGTKAFFVIPKNLSSNDLDADKKSEEGNPPTFYWKRRMSVGINHFDMEHKALFSLTYQMARLKGQPEREGNLRKIFASLEKYAEHHFASEEKVMDQLNYPDFENHKNEHGQFIDWLFAQKNNFQNDPEKFDVEKCSNYLVQWLSDHIMKSDKDYEKFFSENSLKVKDALKDVKHFQVGEGENLT